MSKTPVAGGVVNMWKNSSDDRINTKPAAESQVPARRIQGGGGRLSEKRRWTARPLLDSGHTVHHTESTSKKSPKTAGSQNIHTAPLAVRANREPPATRQTAAATAKPTVTTDVSSPDQCTARGVFAFSFPRPCINGGPGPVSLTSFLLPPSTIRIPQAGARCRSADFIASDSSQVPTCCVSEGLLDGRIMGGS
jgi:hypothetical protein